MRRLATLATGTLLLLALAPAGTAQAAGGRPFTVTMLGANEAPVAGDPDGTGTAELTLNAGLGELCYTLTVEGIEPATLAHVHRGAAGDPGPALVHLVPPTSGTSSGCAPVDRDLARDILVNPENYYVNVHNGDFGGGALRGQLA